MKCIIFSPSRDTINTMGRKMIPTKNIIDKERMLIGLTNGGYAIIDKEDYKKVKLFRWSVAGRGYALGNNKGKTFVKMHRLILEAQPGEIIDHINRNKLDNRKKNLRKVTHSQNMLNGSKRSTNKSGTIGVCWSTNRNRWRAYIVINGKQTNKYFKNKNEAILQRKYYEKNINHEKSKTN